MTPLELASGLLFDGIAGPELPDVGASLTPREALADAVRRALLRPPCLVSFSGGRDSSVILAIAVDVARREGLPLPIPITNRPSRVPSAEETAWQELSVRHLGIKDWIVRECADELDFVGPVAAKILRRHGVIWPENTHFHQPLLAEARGGSLLTGVDGDGLFDRWRYRRIGNVLNRRVRPQLRDAGRIALALAPPAWRRPWFGRTVPRLPWLTHRARLEVARLETQRQCGEPGRWDARVEWFARRRYSLAVQHALGLIAADADAEIHHPFFDPRFLAAFARTGGRWGFGDRSAAMRVLFPDLLPDSVLTRKSKAEFSGLFWGRHSRRFIEAWDGTGVDRELVDVGRLREAWSAPRPHACSAPLLQHAWLHRDSGTASVESA